MSQQFDSSYTQYQLDRSWLRKQVRRLYLRRAASLLTGPTLDFGCGVGELLQLLPAGSRGLEYNEATVAYCRDKGLPVDHYDGFKDDWGLSVLEDGVVLRSMVISHVLEHLDDPMEKFRKLLAASSRLGIERVLVIVPGMAGFRFDDTHITFVDHEMLAGALEGTGFRIGYSSNFPVDIQWIGDWFAYHELQMVFERT